MAKSRQGGTQRSDKYYDLVLNRMVLGGVDGSGGHDGVHFSLQRYFLDAEAGFEIHIENDDVALDWDGNADGLHQVARWFDNAAKLLDCCGKQSEKSGLTKGRR